MVVRHHLRVQRPRMHNDHHLSILLQGLATGVLVLASAVRHSPAVELTETQDPGAANGILGVLAAMNNGVAATAKMMERVLWILTNTLMTKVSTGRGTNDTTEVNAPGKMPPKVHQHRQNRPQNSVSLSSHRRPLHQGPNPRFRKSLMLQLKSEKRHKKKARMNLHQEHPRNQQRFSTEDHPMVPRWHHECAK